MAAVAAKKRAPKPVPDLVRRQRAIEATMKRFGGRNFKLGKVDCVCLARAHAVAMGHRRLPKLPAYSGPAGAMAAIEKLGVADLEELLDRHFTRIAPAAMLPGDLAVMQGDEHFDAVAICVGRKIFGFFEGEDAPVIIVPREIKAAFRV